MPAGNQPSATVAAQAVTVTWSQNSFLGSPLGAYTGGGYTLTRYANGGSTPLTPSASCATRISGAGATLQCIEAGVPYGAWQYAVTPVLNTFTGAVSAKSTATNVVTAAPVLNTVTAQNPHRRADDRRHPARLDRRHRRDRLQRLPRHGSRHDQLRVPAQRRDTARRGHDVHRSRRRPRAGHDLSLRRPRRRRLAGRRVPEQRLVERGHDLPSSRPDERERDRRPRRRRRRRLVERGGRGRLQRQSPDQRWRLQLHRAAERRYGADGADGDHLHRPDRDQRPSRTATPSDPSSPARLGRRSRA
jgi:hypothetical protein